MQNQHGQRRGRILVVDDEPNARQALGALLREDGYDVSEAPDGFKALGLVKEWKPDILLTDVRMPLMDGLELVKESRAVVPELSCIVMTAHGAVEIAVEAMKLGAEDFLTKPLNFDAVELVLERTMGRIALRREVSELRSKRERPPFDIIGQSASLTDLLELTDQVARAQANILITGESGTGKELIAHRIHDMSERVGGPFVVVHCAALPEGLLESELFGHERGAFTGAVAARAGRFEEADGGTIFLDEIGEISPAIQVKLLRVLQSREFQRVGGNKTHRVDVRIVAATNRNLAEEVREGRFREDLYYRLRVIELEVPPLRARRSDIPVLVQHFVAKHAAANGREIVDIEDDAMDALTGWHWPGNVRELENTLERAVVLCRGDTITRDHLPREFKSVFHSHSHGVHIPGATLAELEKYAILETYRATGGSTADTATVLGISQRKVQYRLREYAEEGEELGAALQ